MALAEVGMALALAALPALPTVAAVMPPNPPELQLLPGPPLAACLAPGEHRAFRLAADAANAADIADIAGALPRLVEVTQRGVPLAVAWTAPGGRVTRREEPDGRYTRISLLLPPAGPAPGDDRLDVSAREPFKIEACFTLRWEALRATTAPEERRVAAERATAEAGALAALDTPEARREALARFRAALADWRLLEAGTPGTPAPRTAETLFHLAVLDRRSGEPGQALPLLAEALDRLRRAGDLPGEATTLNEMGFDRALRGEVEPARELYREALSRWEAVPDRLGRAITLNNLALSHHSQGDLRTARASYEEAAGLLEEVGDRATLAVVTNNLGGVFQLLGEPAEAESRYERALDLDRRLGDRHAEAQVLGNLGSIEHDTGQFQKALEHDSRALSLLREEGDRAGEARLLNSLGLAYRSTGELQQARETLEAALALRRQGKDRRGEAITLHNLAVTLRDAGDAAGAAALYEQALALQVALGDRRAEAITRVGLAALDLAAGRRASAAGQAAQAVALLRDLADRRQLCDALRQSGQIAAAGGEGPAAGEQMGEALALCRAAHDREGEARTLLALAALERGAGRDEAAERDALSALDVLESLRAGVGSLDLRASFLARQEDAYTFTRDLFLEHHRREPGSGYDRQAFAVAERGRARSLLELLAEAGSDPGAGIAPALRERRAGLGKRLDAKARRRMDLADRPQAEAERTALDREIAAILEELREVEGEIRTRSPSYAALTQPQPLGAAAVQGLLDPDTLLLAYSLGEERSVLFALTPTSFASFALPPRGEIEKAVREVLADWRVLDPATRRAKAAAAAALSDLLLGPVAGQLPGRRLVVVADGALHLLPFAALPEPTDPVPAGGVAAGGTRERLLEGHEIVNLPSASVLAVQRQRLLGRPPAPRSLAILADPVFRRDDPRVSREQAARTRTAAPAAETRRSGAAGRFDRLRWSRKEAEAIADVADAADAAGDPPLLALDFAANLDTVTGGGLRPYRFVHFATHGVLDGEHPALSGLVLSLVDEAGRDRSGFLRLHDVYDLELGADLVVLSGCQTALGREVRGEGLVGLVRGFFHAGASQVVASLWRVEDRATAELMRRFYQALLGDGRRPAAALRQAQREMLADPHFRDPFYWAGFALYGDWR